MVLGEEAASPGPAVTVGIRRVPGGTLKGQLRTCTVVGDTLGDPGVSRSSPFVTDGSYPRLGEDVLGKGGQHGLQDGDTGKTLNPRPLGHTKSIPVRKQPLLRKPQGSWAHKSQRARSAETS